MMNLRVGLIGLLTFLTVSLYAQEKDSKSISGLLRTRYMSTNNEKDLADFRVLVTHGRIHYSPKINDWLTLGVQLNGLLHYGNNNVLKRDLSTNSGPIYEGNLWHPRHMDGTFEAAMPQLYAKIKVNSHSFTIGRFLKQTPIINPEVWPFPNALQGLWYEFKQDEKLRIQASVINNIAPRQTGSFTGIGESIGIAGIGIDVNGNPNQYRDNTNSDFIGIFNLDYDINEDWKLSFWDFHVQNIFNTSFFESRLLLNDKSLEFGLMSIYQTKVGDGGNEQPTLAYKADDEAFYWGAQVQKHFQKNTLELSFGRITKAGRLLMPREWGLEPFYTMTRRTRIEGSSDATSIKAEWKRTWSNENGDFRAYISIVRNGLTKPSDLPKNKNALPSHFHTDFSIQYKPNSVKGLATELYIGERILDADVPSDSYIINRANFFHFDFFVTYEF